MKHYFFKLNPPRATFMQDMTPEEAKLMQEHVGYWKKFADEGIAVVYGPVSDPKGGFGAGIIELEDGVDPKTLTEEDPVVKAKKGFSIEVHPMRAVFGKRK
jgi:uncharacterized protein YciI